MEALIAHLNTHPATVALNLVQREVLAKMLMNLAYDLFRETHDVQAEIAEALAERLVRQRSRRIAMKFGVVIRNMGPQSTRRNHCCMPEEWNTRALMPRSWLIISPSPQTKRKDQGVAISIPQPRWLPAGITTRIRLGISVLVISLSSRRAYSETTRNTARTLWRTDHPRCWCRLATPGV